MSTNGSQKQTFQNGATERATTRLAAHFGEVIVQMQISSALAYRLWNVCKRSWVYVLRNNEQIVSFTLSICFRNCYKAKIKIF